MKDIILSTAVLLMLCTSCISNSKNAFASNEISKNQMTSKVKSVEVSEKTRGLQKIYTFKDSGLQKKINTDVTQNNLTATTWNMLNEEISKINLEKISTYESPTTQRYSDGALASQIKITVDNKEYISAEFDSGKPPKELAPLYNSLMNAAR
ncbi:hypothetical protein [Chryseobacterium sp. Leaf180]|jgi:hypothetical protein|uniref:hypothetical protein n=1 Tax=Chryseobacterium sp. Leaf180 TaxID=1736289 RepID=UPI00103CB643|nr:hypothetical protein [Chryseobacterium sp. Leaf180]